MLRGYRESNINRIKEWQREGLGVPPVVEEATTEYRQDMDPLKDFIDAYCMLEEGLWASSEQLRMEYAKWAKETGETDLLIDLCRDC